MAARIARIIKSAVRYYRKNGWKHTLHRIKLTLLNEYNYYAQLPSEKYPKELAFWYREHTGETLDLIDPKTYNHKLQWLKLYDATPQKTRLSDKYLVREWVRETIGEEYLTPLLGVWDSFDEIDFSSLPQRFVLKANHGSGWNLIVKDKDRLDMVEAKKQVDLWMKSNFAFFSGFEMQYLNVAPKIIAEEYLENNDENLYDYKVYCFDGKADCILFLSDRKSGVRKAFYDLNWNRLPFMTAGRPMGEDVEKPQNLELLVQLAEKLSVGFPHVRVDFYVLNDGTIKFGEMTFTPASGKNAWYPPEQDRIYGERIRLPEKKPIPQRER